MTLAPRSVSKRVIASLKLSVPNVLPCTGVRFGCYATSNMLSLVPQHEYFRQFLRVDMN